MSIRRKPREFSILAWIFTISQMAFWGFIGWHLGLVLKACAK